MSNFGTIFRYFLKNSYACLNLVSLELIAIHLTFSAAKKKGPSYSEKDEPPIKSPTVVLENIYSKPSSK